jgi:hypothetical protein
LGQHFSIERVRNHEIKNSRAAGAHSTVGQINGASLRG